MSNIVRNTVGEVSSSKEQLIINRSPKTAPDNFATLKYTHDQGKGVFWKFALDGTNSILGIIKEKITDINTALSTIYDNADTKQEKTITAVWNGITTVETTFTKIKQLIDGIDTTISTLKGTDYNASGDYATLKAIADTIATLVSGVSTINSTLTTIKGTGYSSDISYPTIKANSDGLDTIKGTGYSSNQAFTDLKALSDGLNSALGTGYSSNQTYATLKAINDRLAVYDGVFTGLDNVDDSLDTLSEIATKITELSGSITTLLNDTIPDATTITSGLMSANDKTKLNGVSTGANKVEASSTNGKIKIDGTETTVYTLPTLTKDSVGLGNADNTSDLNKPVSTATQTALDKIKALLGAFDTATYSSGVYTITRQTGYAKLSDCGFEATETTNIYETSYFVGKATADFGQASEFTFATTQSVDNVAMNTIQIRTSTCHLKSNKGIVGSIQYKLTSSTTEYLEESALARLVKPSNQEWLEKEYNKHLNLIGTIPEGTKEYNMMNLGLVIGKTYTLSCSGVYLIKIAIGQYDSSSLVEQSDNVTFTWNENSDWKLCFLSSAYVALDLSQFKIMLNEGNTALDYQVPSKDIVNKQDKEHRYLTREFKKGCNLWSLGNPSSSASGDIFEEESFSLPKGKYTLTVYGSGSSVVTYEFKNGSTTLDSSDSSCVGYSNSITLSSDCDSVSLFIQTAGTYQIMLSEGDEVIPYEPYKGEAVHKDDVKMLNGYDNTKGTIEARLSALGFSQGVASTTLGTPTANSLKKQGKYVLFNFFIQPQEIVLGPSSYGTINLPNGFKPKASLTVPVFLTKIDNSNVVPTTTYSYGITVGTDGVITLTTNSNEAIVSVAISNAGWEVN